MKKPLITSGLGVAGLIMLMTAVACIFVAITDKNPAAGLLAVVLVLVGTDAVMFEINYLWCNGGFKERFELWRRRRRWPQKLMVENLNQLVRQDKHWMDHNPIVAALTERYLKAMEQDWYTISFQPSSGLRAKLGIDPTTNAIKYYVIVYCEGQHDTRVLTIPASFPVRDIEGPAFSMFAVYKERCCSADESLRSKQWSYIIARSDVI